MMKIICSNWEMLNWSDLSFEFKGQDVLLINCMKLSTLFILFNLNNGADTLEVIPQYKIRIKPS